MPAPVMLKGVARDVTTFSANSTEGVAVELTADKEMAALLVHQADLTAAKDSVRTVPTAASSSTTNKASSTSPAEMIAANTARCSLILSNTDANAWYGLFGTGTPSATNFSISLPSGGSIQLSPVPKEALQGVWAADGSGYLSICELSE